MAVKKSTSSQRTTSARDYLRPSAGSSIIEVGSAERWRAVEAVLAANKIDSQTVIVEIQQLAHRFNKIDKLEADHPDAAQQRASLQMVRRATKHIQMLVRGGEKLCH